MVDAGARHLGQALVQRHGIEGGQRQVFAFARHDDAQRAEAGGTAAELGPDLAGEFGRRGLAAGAGDGRDAARLLAIEDGGHQRQAPARIGIDQQDGAGWHGRAGLGQYRDRALGHRLVDKAPPVGPGSGQCREDKSWFDLPRIG